MLDNPTKQVGWKVYGDAKMVARQASENKPQILQAKQPWLYYIVTHEARQDAKTRR